MRTTNKKQELSDTEKILKNQERMIKGIKTLILCVIATLFTIVVNIRYDGTGQASFGDSLFILASFAFSIWTLVAIVKFVFPKD